MRGVRIKSKNSFLLWISPKMKGLNFLGSFLFLIVLQSVCCGFYYLEMILYFRFEKKN